MSDELPERVKALSKALDIVAGDREDQYGSPEDSFKAIARHWNAYLLKRREPLEPGDVAAMMVLLKIARMETGGLKSGDSWLDLAGYAGCGFEVSGLKIGDDK